MQEKTVVKSQSSKEVSKRTEATTGKQGLAQTKQTSSCGSCGICSRLSSPRISSEGISFALSQAKAMGKGSCATSFMQRNYGNAAMERIGNNQPSANQHIAYSPLRSIVYSHTPPTISRKCTCGGGCQRCKGEEEAERVSMSIMRMSKPSAISYQPSADYNEQAQINEIMSNKGSGQRLDDNTRSFMEQRFGYDFSHVRLHTDSYAARKSNELNAEAFTIGRDVFFNAGRYEPSTTQGKRLLAHELTHVVQQEYRPYIQRLGSNPGCSPAEIRIIHQAIFNARGWLNKAIPKLDARPLSSQVLTSLRRNFGPIYGVANNASLIRDRLVAARSAIGTIPFSCATSPGDAICSRGHCGWATPGSNATTICSNVTLAAGSAWQFQAGCVLHETFHARFAGMTAAHDYYSGWHGYSGATPGYPGVGIDPLLNADAYTTIVMDLS